MWRAVLASWSLGVLWSDILSLSGPSNMPAAIVQNIYNFLIMALVQNHSGQSNSLTWVCHKFPMGTFSQQHRVLCILWPKPQIACTVAQTCYRDNSSWVPLKAISFHVFQYMDCSNTHSLNSWTTSGTNQYKLGSPEVEVKMEFDVQYVVCPAKEMDFGRGGSLKLRQTLKALMVGIVQQGGSSSKEHHSDCHTCLRPFAQCIS